jgi:hypothetical protein
MDRRYLAETVSRRDAGAEPPWTGSRNVSAGYLRFMSIVNSSFRYIHWHRGMTFVFSPKTRRELAYTDIGNADITSLHGCNLVGQYRSNCRGANICHPWGIEPLSDHYGRWQCRFCRSKNLPCGIRSQTTDPIPCL